MSGAVNQNNYTPSLRAIDGSEQDLTVDDTAGGVALAAAAVPETAQQVLLQVQDADVRVTFDPDATVTASAGFVLYAGDPPFPVSRRDALEARFIRVTSTSATLHSVALR